MITQADLDRAIKASEDRMSERLRQGKFPVRQHAYQHAQGGIDRLTPDGGPPTGVAGGELNGTYPNPSVDATHGGSAHHAAVTAGSGIGLSGQVVSAMRTATLFVAANDATAAEKAGADYLCDGTADDVQINAAIAALPAGGGRVVLSSGAFNIAASIVPDASTLLEGQGQATILKAIASLNSDIIATPGSGNIRYAQFRQFKIDGNRSNNTSGRGIYLYSARNCSIEHIWFTETDEQAIYLDGAVGPNQGWYNWITENEIDQCDAGIFIDKTEFNYLFQNTITYVVGVGIWCAYDNDRIINNVLDQVTGQSIHVEFGAGRWEIVGNVIDHPGTDAIVMRGASATRVSRNRITNLPTNAAGISNGEFVSTIDHCDDLICDYNVVEKAAGATGTIGIREIEAVNDASYSNNHFVGLATPMSLDGASTGVGYHNTTDAGAIADIGSPYGHATSASAISILDTANDFTATDVEGALAELQADNEAHVAAADPHTVYHEATITIENPSASENIVWRHFHAAVTITAIRAVVIGGTSVTIDPCHGTTITTATKLLSAPEVVASASTYGEHIGGADTANDVPMAASFNDATLAAEDFLRMVTTGISGTPTQLSVTIRYRLT